MDNQKQKIALVLSSGGARGVAHIGVIEELLNQGFEITSLAGSSMGAVVSGLYALGKLDDYKEWLLKLKKADVFNLLDFTFSKSGIIKGDKVFSAIKKFIPDRCIEDLDIPYVALATDIINEVEYVFDKGSIYEAMRASVAIPSLFLPVEKNGIILVDGGVLNPLPIKYVKRTAGDILVAVNLYANIHEKEINHVDYLNVYTEPQINDDEHDKILKKPGYFKLLDYTSQAMVNKLAELAIEIYKPDIMINIPRNVGNTFEFHKAEKFINNGREAAKIGIAEYFENHSLSDHPFKFAG
jgi:NTE family protein